MAVESDAEPRMLHCQTCQKPFTGPIGLGVHIARAHGPNAGWSTKRQPSDADDCAELEAAGKDSA